MTPEVVPPDTPAGGNLLVLLASNLGQMFVGAAITGVGSIMWFFTKRHIASMDQLAAKFEVMSQNVSAIAVDIKGMRESHRRLEDRVSRLEDRQMDD